MRLRHQQRIFFPAAVIILFAVTTAAQGTTSSQSLEQGIELLRQARSAEAERLFLHLVKLNSNDAASQYYLALSLSQQGRLDEARIGFEQVLRIDPRHGDACFEIAGIYVKSRNYPAAQS